MFDRVLVANRGEIALRIIRACRELGLRSVLVCSEADRQSLPAELADRVVCLPGFKPADTYLNMEAIIQAARETGCQAVHPGYGYLSENPHFARRCQQAGLVFIGPSPDCLALAGSKLAARERAAAAGVPVLPGSPQGVADRGRAQALAAEIGYPVILKASAGGGGRGMRVCRDSRELGEELAIARAEAAAAFGDGTLYMEKYLVWPRHIEVQILGDRYGQLVHLGERECSVQRRYQKLVEESPSPALDEDLRQRMGAAALKVAAALGYSNAGTVEFLLDEQQNFYFMEINARLQVEHPVTEMVSGVDLVQEQLRLAAGAALAAAARPAGPRGWAIECRINAEDPRRGFLPSPGTIQSYRPPGGPGVRLDTHIYQGYQVPPYYDSLLAKLVAWGPDRTAALRVMQRALGEFVIAPVQTTIDLHRQIMADADFQAGRYDTGFVQRFLPPDGEDD